MPFRAILFDLDGTLVDTAPEIADALNDTLARLGHPVADEARVRGWIGDGAHALLERALAHAGAAPGAAEAAWPGFADDYARRCGTRSHVHAGVPEMLALLRRRGLKLALLTNKEGGFTRRVLAHHGLLSAFDVLVNGDTLAVKKPDPAVVTHALAALGVAPAQALLVGDSVTDVRAARAAGIAVWLVGHGYPQGALSGADAPDGFIADFDSFDPAAAPAASLP